MLGGFWAVDFILKPPIEMRGAGLVVFFKNQRILGGDSNYFYSGSYEIKDGVVEGEVEVKYLGTKASSLFGPVNRFRIKFSGKARPRNMELQGHVVEDPNRKFDILLNKRAELPEPCSESDTAGKEGG